MSIDLYLTQLAEEFRFRAWGGGNLLNEGVDLLKRGFHPTSEVGWAIGGFECAILSAMGLVQN